MLLACAVSFLVLRVADKKFVAKLLELAIRTCLDILIYRGRIAQDSQIVDLTGDLSLHVAKKG